MSRRAELLAEMGLAPQWRLRDAPTADSAAMPAASSVELPVEPAANDAPIPDDRALRIGRMDWTELQATVSACTACGLCRSRTNTVFGVGDQQAQLLIVGEAPGQEEDARGEPFVGQAGRLLDNMLAAIGMRRGDNVYIANVLKCRPPGNRNPAAEEVAACSAHLKRQIELIRPLLIVAMGRFAAQTLLDSTASIASLRGRTHEYNAVPTIVTYHPAYLLRTPADKAKAWEDLCFARSSLLKLTPAAVSLN